MTLYNSCQPDIYFSFNMAHHLSKGREENQGSALKRLIGIPVIIEEVIHSYLVHLHVFTSVMLGLTQTLTLSMLFDDPGIRLDDNITATASALLTQNIMIR